jgi:hypothetical protein
MELPLRRSLRRCGLPFQHRTEARAGRMKFRTRKPLPQTVDEWIAEFTDDFGYAPLMEGKPTRAIPGSPEKVEVLKSRADKGQPLFMKEDYLDADTLDLQPVFSEHSHCDPVLKTSWKGNELAGAEFSPCGTYRYRLWRHWAKGLPVACFIGLNPSTADETKMDNTMRRIKNFAKSWGCGGFEMLNLFGLRSTDPKALYTHSDPIGPGNDRAIRLTVRACSYVVCCWGVHGVIDSRSAQVLWAISKTISKSRVYCLGLTQPIPGGMDDTISYPQPRHPLYLKRGTKAIALPWDQLEVAAAV